MSDHEPEDDLARSDREWAAQASQFPAASTPGAAPASGAHGPAAVPGAGGGSVGPTGSAGPTRSAGPKPVRGPSGNAMGWMRGLGLLSVLVTIAIMALLSWRILSDTDGDDVDVVRDPGPASTAAPVDPAGGAQLGEGGSTDRAAAAACEVNRRTVETAAEAYAITNGSPPANLEQLIDSGLLVPDTELQVEITPTGEVVSTGACAGG